MIKRCFCWSALFVTAMSGMAQAETIVFNPPAGSERTYHFEVSMSSGIVKPDGYVDHESFSTLTRFKVAGREGDNRVSLETFPLYFSYSDGPRTVSSALGDFPDDLAKLMREGFVVSLDTESHQITSFAPRGDGEMPGAMRNMISNQLAQPMTPVAITVEENWHTTGKMSGIDNVDITVSKVTPDKVYIRYEGHADDLKMSGLSVVARKTGWVESAVLTVENRSPRGKDKERFLRQTIVMTTAESPYPLPDARFKRDQKWSDMKTGPLPSILAQPDPDLVFPDAPGTVDKYNDILVAEFDHDVGGGFHIGRFAVHDLQLFDQKTALDTAFIADYPGTYAVSDNVSRTMFQARPIGIGDARDNLRKATEMRAKVDWFPASPFTMTLHPNKDGTAHVAQNGASVRLTPTDDGYELLASGKPWDYFAFSFPEGSKVKARFYADDRGPDWLSSEESLARRLAQPNYSAVRIPLKTDKVPAKIDIRVFRYTEDPKVSKEVVFLTKRGARLDPEIEPKLQPLFAEGAPPALGDVTPDGLDLASLRFSLATEQAQYCRAALEKPASLARHDLVFKKTQPDSQPGVTVWEMQTDDGIRQHFYGHDPVTVVLNCDAKIEWQETAVKPDPERPWQIDLEALGTASSMTIAEFNRRFRIVDADGTALALVSPGEAPLSPTDTLASALFEDGHIRAAGRPARILKAVEKDQQVSRRIEARFPDLPEPWEDAQ
ncbi:hypothetical protein TH25_22295 [Thalassospira profundimaris]|uniref:DUF4424 domain-containing protein n=1 Tax=Thalassospira profundimaris TaxID=502049 RepID=A0A367WPF7_9PROT|nr:hypothetical protein [Thalassospira profundimaris]RCK43079.1 hypothetical protein TH25_22295 [Thalassospira profundimaris]